MMSRKSLRGLFGLLLAAVIVGNTVAVEFSSFAIEAGGGYNSSM